MQSNEDSSKVSALILRIRYFTKIHKLRDMLSKYVITANVHGNKTKKIMNDVNEINQIRK